MTAEVAPAVPTTPKPRASTAGIVVTIVLCVLLLGFGAIMGVFSAFLAFASDACGSGSVACNDEGIGVGILVAVVGTVGAALLGTIFGVIWAARRKRLAWIFPIVGGVLVVILFAVGAAITFGSSGGSFS